MKIGILGCRGIPNNYGGFEQFAEYLSKYLVEKGHNVFVYNSHNHPYKYKIWEGVNIIHKFDPEVTIGTAGQFVYDLNCILDSRKRSYDLILQLGYTSCSVWGPFLPNRSIIVTNMDGLEWKRSKYSKLTRKFLQFAEKLGVKYSDHLISDSIGIKKYLFKKYSVNSQFIPYGSNLTNNISENVLDKYGLDPFTFSMLIARLEPENSVEIILNGVQNSEIKEKFLVIGKCNTKYGKDLTKKYFKDSRIKFLDGIYDIHILNTLRYYSKLYFHGHTVGGTNPSLLEAMGSQALICAHDNIFNRSILGDDAFYFKSSFDVSHILNTADKDLNCSQIANNIKKIIDHYSWENIVSEYENLFVNLTGHRSESSIASVSQR
jgi:glycosyltransferase involved in cell wall biosynthesis